MQIKKDTLIKIAVAVGCSLVVVAMIIFKVFEIFNINLVREESSHLFKHGLVQVKADGKYGYADKSGRIVIPFVFDDAYSFEQGACRCRNRRKMGLYRQKRKDCHRAAV